MVTRRPLVHAQAARRLGRVTPDVSPRTVIRGERKEVDALVDYLDVTLRQVPMSEILEEVTARLGIEEPQDRGKGLHGYTRSLDLGGFGLVGYGGPAQGGTVLVQINGHGCGRIADMAGFASVLEKWGATITRCDVAVDDLKGEAFTIRKAVNAWKRGQFNLSNKRPKSRLVDDLGNNTGKTFYVGSRKSGKLCRVYEKGKQLGDEDGKWVRCEVEYHDKDRVLPFDMLRDPAAYVAGSYPFFQGVSIRSCMVATGKVLHDLTLRHVVQWARRAVGRTVNVMLREAGGDIGAVIAALVRPGIPRRLRHEYTDLMAPWHMGMKFEGALCNG